MSTRHIVYMDLRALTPAVRNPKDHDLPSLVASLRRYGWTAPAELDERTGRLVAGHGRREATMLMWENGEPPPAGVHVDDDGEWLVPVLRGWSSRNDTEAEAYIIAANKITEAGGWFLRDLAAILEDVVTTDAPLQETLGMTFEDIDALLARVDPETLGEQEDDGPVGAPDPDPHTDLTDDDTDPAAVAPGRRVSCPSCGHEFEDN